MKSLHKKNKALTLISKLKNTKLYLEFIKLKDSINNNKYIKKIKETKVYNYLRENYKSLLSKIFALFFVPLVIFYFSQFFCNGKLEFEKPRMKANFLFIYVIILFIYAIVGKIKLTYYISFILTFIIGIANHFITTFRGTPLVPWDIFSVNVALTVLPTFKITFSKNAFIGTIIFIFGLLVLKKLPIKSFKNNILKIAYRLVAIFLVTSFIFQFYTTDLIDKFELDENWDPKEEYHNNGLIASLFKQSRNLIIREPDGYNIETLKKIANDIEIDSSSDSLTNSIQNTITDESTNTETLSITTNSEPYETPNIIAIMNESFADLSVIDKFSTNIEYMPFFKSLKENTVKGNLHVSIFGATTPNTEWEFLTSNSMAFVPYRTVPYQQYIFRPSYSLASILKDYNYSTSAIHCYYPQGYNRSVVYPLLGFETFKHIYSLNDLNYIREYPDDLSTYKNIIEIFENKSENEKMFNFTLTMQNHGSYTDESFPSTVVVGNGEYPRLNQYLSLIKISDDSFKYLVDYFSNIEEPTIIVMFGDHQPYVEDEFYDKLLSSYENTSSKETIEKKYITPYIIWANYDFDYSKYQANDISVNYLASLILDIAGIKKTPYLQFLDQLREEIPIITGNGYMDKNKIYHSFDEETEYSSLIENYHYLQYNNMFDNNSKLTNLFEVSK